MSATGFLFLATVSTLVIPRRLSTLDSILGPITHHLSTMYSGFDDRVVLRLSSIFLLFNHDIYYVDFQPSTLGRDPLLRTLSTPKLKAPRRKTFKTFVDAVGVQFTGEPLKFLDNLPVTTTADRPRS